MLDIFKEYATDEKLELGGVTKELGEGKFTIGRARNDNYLKFYGDLQAANADKLRLGGEEAKKLSEELLLEVYAKTILLGWENVAFQGKKLPYSTENAIKLLRVKDFFAVVNTWAHDIANFKAVEVQEDAGN